MRARCSSVGTSRAATIVRATTALGQLLGRHHRPLACTSLASHQSPTAARREFAVATGHDKCIAERSSASEARPRLGRLVGTAVHLGLQVRQTLWLRITPHLQGTRSDTPRRAGAEADRLAELADTQPMRGFPFSFATSAPKPLSGGGPPKWVEEGHTHAATSREVFRAACGTGQIATARSS